MPVPLIGIPCANHRPKGEQKPLSKSPEAPAFQVPRSYVEAVARAGGAPVLLPSGLSIDMLEAILCRLQGLLLAGGPDVDPEQYGAEPHQELGHVDRGRDDTELWLTRRAIERDLPVLAICRGLQVLNVAAGGTLYQDLASEYAGSLKHDRKAPDYPLNELAHWVEVLPATKLRTIMGASEVQVNSRHHQAVRELGRGLQTTARAADGVIEGIEMLGRRFVVGVQWHPENLIEDAPAMLRLFRTFVEEAGHAESR